MFYRVLNPLEESSGIKLNSNHQTNFRKEVFSYRKLSHCIYILSLKTGIQIQSAVQIAENVPAFLDILNEFFQSGKEKFDLTHIGVEDPVKILKGDDLYAFTYNYITEVNESGLYYDWGKEHYFGEFAWEMVRSLEFPDKPSRMDSVFLFKSKKDADIFRKQYRDLRFETVQVDLLDGNSAEFDMNWFSNVPSNISVSEMQEYARKYWKQEMTETPIIEILHKGHYAWE